MVVCEVFVRAPGARGGRSGAAAVGAGVACGEGDGNDELGAEDVGEVPGRRRGMGSLPGDRREIRRALGFSGNVHTSLGHGVGRHREGDTCRLTRLVG